jgi:hypothetical protein
MIDAFLELSELERAELDDRAVLRKKGHLPKNNPHRPE